MPTTLPRRSRRGAILPLVALLLPVMLVLASFAINLAYMELTRTELRIASDAATRASGYTLMTTGDTAAARAAAREGASRNQVAGRATQLADSDIVFGISQRSSVSQRYTFTPGGTPPNSVRVSARRSKNSLSGAVGMIMPTFGAVKEFSPTQSATSTQVEIDIALVLDRSGSMAYGDLENSEAMAAAGQAPSSAPAGWRFCDAAPPGSRWRDLTKAVDTFISTMRATPQRESVALVTYSDGSKREAQLTTDYATLPRTLDPYTNAYCMGYTNIQAGIAEGISALMDPRFSRPWAVKVVIVLTDGRRTAGSDPVPTATSAFGQGISVYAITFAQEADQTLMKRVAAAAGGTHSHAATGEELIELFKKIAGELPTLLTQ
jgi:Ca-activated chloride channel family protein